MHKKKSVSGTFVAPELSPANRMMPISLSELEYADVMIDKLEGITREVHRGNELHDSGHDLTKGTWLHHHYHPMTLAAIAKACRATPGAATTRLSRDGLHQYSKQRWTLNLDQLKPEERTAVIKAAKKL